MNSVRIRNRKSQLVRLKLRVIRKYLIKQNNRSNLPLCSISNTSLKSIDLVLSGSVFSFAIHIGILLFNFTSLRFLVFWFLYHCILLVLLIHLVVYVGHCSRHVGFFISDVSHHLKVVRQLNLLALFKQFLVDLDEQDERLAIDVFIVVHDFVQPLVDSTDSGTYHLLPICLFEVHELEILSCRYVPLLVNNFSLLQKLQFVEVRE